MNHDTRGVSEVLGFILVFAMVVSSIAIIYGTGIGSLTQVTESEQLANADRAFIALSESFDDINRGHAPGRAGEMRLVEGTLSFEDATAMQVVVDNGTSVTQVDIDKEALVYRGRNGEVWFDNGAVIFAPEGGQRMSREPSIRCSDSSAVLSFMTFDAEGNTTSFSERGSVLVTGREKKTQLHYPTTVHDQSSATVTVTIQSSENMQAWNQYFEQTGWTETATDTYTCTTKGVVVRETLLGVKILR